METCTFPGCGYKADFISKIHCRLQHDMEREEIYKKYGKKTDLKNNRAQITLIRGKKDRKVII